MSFEGRRQTCDSVGQDDRGLFGICGFHSYEAKQILKSNTQTEDLKALGEDAPVWIKSNTQSKEQSISFEGRHLKKRLKSS